MNAISEEMQGYVDVLEAAAVALLPDEKPRVRQPLLTDEIIHVKLFVRAGRNMIPWSVPEAALGDDSRVADSLEKAIATVGLAGIVRVVRTDRAAAPVEPGSNVIPPNPAVPPSLPPMPIEFADQLLAMTNKPADSDFFDDLLEPGDDPDTFAPLPPPPAEMQQQIAPPKPSTRKRR